MPALLAGGAAVPAPPPELLGLGPPMAVLLGAGALVAGALGVGRLVAELPTLGWLGAALGATEGVALAVALAVAPAVGPVALGTGALVASGELLGVPTDVEPGT